MKPYLLRRSLPIAALPIPFALTSLSLRCSSADRPLPSPWPMPFPPQSPPPPPTPPQLALLPDGRRMEEGGASSGPRPPKRPSSGGGSGGGGGGGSSGGGAPVPPRPPPALTARARRAGSPAWAARLRSLGLWSDCVCVPQAGRFTHANSCSELISIMIKENGFATWQSNDPLFRLCQTCRLRW